MDAKRVLIGVGMAASSFIVADPATAVPADSERCVEVPDAAPGDLAVINITNTGAAGVGYGALRSSDLSPVFLRDADERFSSVNFSDVEPVNPNLAMASVGLDGTVCYDGAESAHDVVLDLTGVLRAASGGDVVPVRLADTRRSEPIRADTSICVATIVGDVGDVAIVNITPVNAQEAGYGTLRAPTDPPTPERDAADRSSSVNFAPGTAPDPNLAVVTLGADGEFCYDASAEHDVLLDLTAVLPADAMPPIAPRRLADTRDGSRVEAGTTICVGVDGAMPGDGAFVNITNTSATGAGYGSLRSSDATAVHDRSPAERTSSVNFAPDTPPNPNLALATVGADGMVCHDTAGSSAHVILDLFAIVAADERVQMTPTRLLDTRLLSETCTPFAAGPPPTQAKEVTRNFSPNEFQRLVDLTSDAGIIATPPPPILGDTVADQRIRFIAEQRGYRQRRDVGASALVTVPGGQLTPPAAAAWQGMVADARNDGVTLTAASAYRSIARQRAIFVGKLSARGHGASSVRAGRADAVIDDILRFSSIPGYSRHHTGVALDILSPGYSLGTFDRSAAYRWLSDDNFASAKQHGFVPSYPDGAGRQGPTPEPWEFVFVGIDALRASTESLDRISVSGDVVTIAGTVDDPDRIIEVYDDDGLVLRAFAGCVRDRPIETSPTLIELTVTIVGHGDVCVVARAAGGPDRLLGCTP